MFIFDIEIKHGIPPASAAERQDGIIYCAGWEDYAAMGVACVGCYDYTADKYRVFGDHDLEDFQKFVEAHDRLVGFNNNRFDNNVLRAAGVVIPSEKSYDLLSEIYSALGSYQKGCRLADVVKANFPNAAGKSGNGADAPILWQRGFHTRVIDYCLNDVRLTKMILDRVLRFGYINNPVNPSQTLRLRRP
jgi:hypothetical protein